MNALDRMLAERNAALLELAALKGQEPVMQHCPNCNHEQTALSVDCGNCGNVYDAAPVQAQERKPLTDEQIDAMWHNTVNTVGICHRTHARAIEAAHGIK